MKIKAVTSTAGTLYGEVQDEAKAVALLRGEAVEGFLPCLNEQGWPFVLNPAQCVTIEKAAT